MKKHGIRINVNIAHHGTKFKKRGNKRMRRHMTRKRTLKGGTKTRKDLMEVANAWIGHGTYVLEKNKMIVENQDTKTSDDEYIPYDFLIRFANYGQFNSETVKDLYHRILHSYSDARYADKSLAMNCWQFVLICLLESGYIDEALLKILYHNYDSNPLKDTRLPDYFGKTYSSHPVPGDIILFQRKQNGSIWHVAILTAIKNNDGDASKYEYIEMLGDKVHQSSYIYDATGWDNLLFITPENLIAPFASLTSDGLPIQAITYSTPQLRRFLVKMYFKNKIFAHATAQWNQKIESSRGPVDYELLYKTLDSSGYSFIKERQKDGVDYTFGNPNFYEERSKRLFLNNPEFENVILEEHGVLRFAL